MSLFYLSNKTLNSFLLEDLAAPYNCGLPPHIPLHKVMVERSKEYSHK